MLKLIRSSLFALSAAGVAALIVRMNGSNPTPPHQGGWRELSGPNLR